MNDGVGHQSLACKATARAAESCQADRIRAASTAALRALSTPTHATGTPGGIWLIASSASSPPATEVLLVSGTPITGQSECADTTPGRHAASPAPAYAPRK